MAKERKAPKLRFKGFIDNWEQQKLGSLLKKLYNGQTPSRNNPNYWNGTINWLSSGELNHNFIKKTSEKITQEGQKSAHLKIVPANTFVMAITGLEAEGTRGSDGITAIDTTVNQSTMALYNDKKKLSTLFLFFWYEKVGNHYGIKYTQGTKQQSYNAELIKILPINLPAHITEQTRITNLLIKLNKIISLQQLKLDELKKLKRGFLQKLFPASNSLVPSLRFKGFSDNWKKQRIFEVATIQDNKRIPVTQKKRIHGTTPYYGANGVQDFIEGYTHDGEFILLAEDGASSVSNYPVYITHGKVWINNHAHVLKPNKEANITCLAYSLKSVDYNKYLEGSGRLKLTLKGLSKIIVKLPIPSEQQKIGQFLQELDSQIDFQQHKIDKLNKFKKFLLQNMFI